MRNCDELDVCCSRKKGTPFIVKFLGLIGGFVLANIAGTAAVYVRNMKKMKENDCQYKAMHSVTMNKGVVSLSGDIQKAYLTCMTGIMDINFTEVPVNDDVYLDLISVLGKVNVNLPVGVNVDLTETVYAKRSRMLFPTILTEHRPYILSDIMLLPRW